MLPGFADWWLIPAAVALDALWGDPALPWRHPVCWIGDALHGLEPVARRFGASRVCGVLCVCLVVGGTGAVVWALTQLPYVGPLLALYFAYAGLAAGSLHREVGTALRIMEHGSLEEGQKALSMLVSRDTTVLDARALRKSLGDTLSENLTDAVIAPLFWLAVGGPVGLWMYKASSTMDSMWGYKTPRWINLGWAGAKLDDVLAWVPARLGVLCLALTYKLKGSLPAFGGRWPGWAVIAVQARGIASPNAGWSMAASAWVMGACLAGPAVYFGEMVQKPWLGDPELLGRRWDAPRIAALNDLIRDTGFVLTAMLCAAGALLSVMA